MKKYFKIFSNCFLVNGFSRSLICDPQRNNYDFIPNDLYDILKKYDRHTIEDVKKDFELENHSIINGYFEFLYKNEYIFYCDKNQLDLFPSFDKTWQSSSHITNAVIDVSSFEINEADKLLNELDKLGCKYYLLITKNLKNNEYWANILKIVEKYRIYGITIYSSYFEEIDNDDFYNLLLRDNRIEWCILFNSPYSLVEKSKHKLSYNPHHFNESSTKITPTNFHIELSLFLEAHYYNTYFNQKIYINEDGGILNAVNTHTVFGNCFHDNIADIINSDAFRILWNANKDRMTICKDCEFRYICYDQRIPILKNDEWNCEDECPYNPYAAKWVSEDGYISVKEDLND